MKKLISELNDFLAHNQEEFDLVRRSGKRDYIISKLSHENAEIYASLPESVARQLTSIVTRTATYRCRLSRQRSSWPKW